MIVDWPDLLLLLLLLGLMLAIVLSRATQAAGDPPVARYGLVTLTGFPSRMARQSGIISSDLKAYYWPAKLLLALLLPLLALEVFERLGDPPPPATAAALVPLGFFSVDAWLLMRRRSRQRRIEAALSYLLDLIAAYLLAGLSLEQAFSRAGRHGFAGDHPLADEVRLIGHELAGGRDRGTAFQVLAERTGVADTYRLATAISIGLRLGGSIRETVEGQSNLLRLKRREEGMKRINRKMLEAMLPLLLIGFPMFMVLVIFPAVVEIFSTMTQLPGYAY